VESNGIWFITNNNGLHLHVLNEDVNFTKQQPTVIFSCVA